MLITCEHTDIDVHGSPMRMFIAAPRAAGRFPGMLVYSDIFQLTDSTVRACQRLSGYGFVVAAPEIYHRIEPPGTAFPFDDEGRIRGLSDAAQTTVSEFGEDCEAALRFLAAHAHAEPGRLGAAGFCIGGHLAFRAAMQPEVRATACFYPTGLHNGKVAKDADAGSLERAAEIRGDILLIFGTLDPHIPAEGRDRIEQMLRQAGTKYTIKSFEAEHAFMRDEGPRYDSEAADQAWSESITFLRSVFSR